MARNSASTNKPPKRATKNKRARRAKSARRSAKPKLSTGTKRKSKQAAAMERAEDRKAPAVKKSLKQLQKFRRTLHRVDKRKKTQKYDKLPFNVVDEHNGSMVCILRAIEQGYLPAEGISLLHFDSHPDLGTLEFDEGWDGMDDLYKGRYSIRELYEQTDIATWIVPMAYMGHVNHVTWVSAWWCDQFKTGTFKLLVGKDKNDGKMKIGTPDDKRPKCLVYWMGDDAVCKKADFEFHREWTLSVVRCRKNTMALPQEQLDILKEQFGKKPWVLDIDEDFFSCNNPYLDDFRDLFGEKAQEAIFNVYNVITVEGVETQEKLIEQLYKDKAYMKRWATFCETALYKQMYRNLACDRKKANMKDFYDFLRLNFPTGGYLTEVEMEEEKKLKASTIDEEEKLEEPHLYEVQDFFSLMDVHRAGQLAALPHHISNVKEFTALINEIDFVLNEISEKPTIVTIATSRRDRYLPDSQAATIHSTLDMVLCNRLGLAEPTRLDRPSFSVWCKNKDCKSEKPVKGSKDLTERFDVRYVTDILAPEPL